MKPDSDPNYKDKQWYFPWFLILKEKVVGLYDNTGGGGGVYKVAWQN